MTKFRKIIIAALAAALSFLGAAVTTEAPTSALTATATQTVTINATAAAWDNNINTYYLSSNTPLRYIISNAIGIVDEVYIDGDLLDPSNYSVHDVTPKIIYLAVDLHAAYLETLELGQHTIDVVFTNSNVLSDIFFIEPKIQPPNTGFFGSLAAGLGGAISNPIVLGTLGIAMLAGATFIVLRRRTHRAQSIQLPTGLKITRRKGVVLATTLLAATAITGALILNHTPEPASAAPATPIVAINPDHLQYDLIVGGTATLDFQSVVTSPIFAAGYTLTAVSDNTNSDIALNISGGSLPTFEALPASPSTPLAIRNYAGTSYSSHTSTYHLAVTLDDYIPIGIYTLTITYSLDTDDQEYFQFTIDTRMTNTPFADGDTPETNPAHFTNTATTFILPTNGRNGATYSWLVDWGDNTTQIANGSTDASPSRPNPGIPHTYDSPGEYQITITLNGPTTIGWMDSFGFSTSSSYGNANTQANKDMFKSIDVLLTNDMRTPGTSRFSSMFLGARNATSIPANLFSQISTTGATNLSFMFFYTFHSYAQNSTTATIPAGLFATIDTSNATDLSSMFNNTFHSYAQNSTTGTIPAGLFATIDTSNATDLSSMFNNTFNSSAQNSTTATIPAGLFDTIDTSGATGFSRMFESTFSSYARNNLSATIPAGLFDSIDTSSATNLEYMFQSTFSYYAQNSTTATIPAGLFDSIDTSSATNLARMFNSTFRSYAQNSTTATIPAGLFDSIDTSKATNLTYMFESTFDSYARNSTIATIPVGLFDSIDTSSATGLSFMFEATFDSYAQNSTTATIPAGLFDSIDLSSATNLARMFSSTFRNYAYNSTTATIPAGLFDSIDTSNATNLAYMFYITFSSYARNSTIATIPAGLFDSIDTSNVTDLSSMFGGTFGYHASGSTTATIPAGLFDSIDTSSATNLYNMFSGTFRFYAQNSTTGTIPAGLFATIDTSSATNVSEMFSSTFSSYAQNSTTATIPAGLFDSIDLSSATNLSHMFATTFRSYASTRTSIGTDINDIWGDANFAGKITAANISVYSSYYCTPQNATRYGVFCLTFYDMPSLGGSAQTFIDTYLGGINPDLRAYTFYGTNVSDLSALHANWR